MDVSAEEAGSPAQKILMERDGRREREELRRIKILLSRALQRNVQESFAHIQSHISALYLPTVFTNVTVQEQLLLEGDKHKHHSPRPQPLSRFRTSAPL